MCIRKTPVTNIQTEVQDVLFHVHLYRTSLPKSLFSRRNTNVLPHTIRFHQRSFTVNVVQTFSKKYVPPNLSNCICKFVSQYCSFPRTCQFSFFFHRDPITKLVPTRTRSGRLSQNRWKTSPFNTFFSFTETKSTKHAIQKRTIDSFATQKPKIELQRNNLATLEDNSKNKT